MRWDSQALGLPVGKLVDFFAHNLEESLSEYALVFARVPQQSREVVAKLQALDFQYVGLDMSLVADPGQVLLGDDVRWEIRRITRSVPDFQISGFCIEGSRLMLDSACRERLPETFWDGVVSEHCAKFADTVICALDTKNRLAGFISCLMQPTHLDLFLVAVHPAYQGKGLGGVLLSHAAALARECRVNLRTNVMSTNVRGVNFYLKHKFVVDNGEVIMHRWRDMTRNAISHA